MVAKRLLAVLVIFTGGLSEMMAKLYLTFGVFMILSFLHFNHIGWGFMHALGSGSWGPKGPAGYHK